MAVPDLVRERLGGEKPLARVPLGSDDELWITPTRGLVYRAEGLLSGETVEDHPLAAQTIVVTEGRRKTTLRLDRGYDGADEFTVPAKHAEEALRPIVQGVLISAGVAEDGESVKQVFRLGELTLIVTDGRVVKYVGSALWTEEDYEEYPYDEVTDLDLEHGSVSSELVIEVDGRPQRIKTPSEDAHEIRKTVEGPLLARHGVDSVAALRRQSMAEADEPAPEPTDEGAPIGETTTDDGLGSLLEFGGLDDTGSDGEPEADVSAPAPPADGDLGAELVALREAVERQGDLLAEQGALLERLIEELKRAG